MEDGVKKNKKKKNNLLSNFFQQQSCKLQHFHTAGKRSNTQTPHLDPALFREMVIKRHTLPVSPKYRMLLTSHRY